MDIYKEISKKIELKNTQDPIVLINASETLLVQCSNILSNIFKSNIVISIVQTFEDIYSVHSHQTEFKVGDRFTVGILEKLGFERVNRVWNQAEYSVLGDVVVLWRKGDLDVTRLSLDGDVIESISTLEESTRRYIAKLDSIELSDDTRAIYKIKSSSDFELEKHIYFVRGERSLNGIDLGIRPFPGERISQIEQVIKSYISQGYKVYLSSENDVKIDGVEKIDQKIERGFVIPNAKISLITDFELSGKLDLTDLGEKNDKSQKLFKEITRGDYVVHEDHGIGVYTDLVTIDEKQYLDIRYAKQDRLLVPLSSSKKISKYIGSGNTKPHLTGLNSGVWHRIKSKAKEDIMRMANELVGIYAMRSLTKSPQLVNSQTDRDELNSFVAKFKYPDTEDQDVITKEIVADLSKSSPMDRLIVGDVGFGKTELAARTVFLAVNAGYQAVIMAPTTILSMQHLAVFKDRFKEYPYRIEVLNRFITGKEREKILRDISAGLVDIVIGTHSLLSDEIGYKSLGLLVIDEEQKFGVVQKEKIKQKRLDINVLSMTATPIPRTLNMALSRIRDLSILSSAPSGRKSIENHIGEFNWEIVTKAINYEIKRGGQVYYMHNRVAQLNVIASELRERVDGIQVGVVHGQMGEHAMGKVMQDFAEGKLDVLVCSSIVENGLDIPRVNTIIIDDAQRYGLSSLYQIRGRVGRSSIQAYAYILYTSLKGDALLRIDAIAEANNIGSGFILSNRDLEIRGAGNILGKSQSGAINSIGYAMYTQLLGEAVRKLQARKY